MPQVSGTSFSSDFVDREARAIFDSISDAFVVLDSEWRIRYLNSQASHISGKAEGALLGRTLWEEWPDLAATEVECQFRRALRDQVSVQMEHRSPGEGLETWLDIHAYPFGAGLAVLFCDISGRKRIAEKLLQSEELYRATFDYCAIGIAHVGLDGRWIRFNDAICKITGYSREELKGQCFRDITHPDDREADWEQARRLAAGEIQTCSLEKRYVRKDGSEIWVALTASLVRDRQGAPSHYISVVEDISARKQAESTVRERDERLKNLLENLADAVMVLDRGWRFVYVNSAWERSSGIPRLEVLGKVFGDVFPAARGTNIESEFVRSMRERVPVEFEAFYEPWGRWFLNRVFPTEDGGLTCYTTEITEKKAALEQLRDSEEHYRRLVSAISAFLWTSDARGEFSSQQPSWEAYTGQPWEAYRGNGWMAMVHPEDRDRVTEIWRDAVNNKSLYEVEWRAWHAASGRWRHCLTRGVPVFSADGEVSEWVAAVIDIHERKLLEMKLQEEDKRDSLGVLAGGIAHDFNNLLVGILGNASLALHTCSLGDGQRGLLESVIRSAERAAELTRQMLAYAGKGQFVFEVLNLSAEVRQVIQLMRSSLRASTRLTLDLDDSLPSIRGDRGQIQQVIMNLLLNAGEALPEDGGAIRVATARETAGRRVLLTVQDNGVGMNSEVKARIFDPFYTTKFTGRGLGLAAVMGVVRAHNGVIEVETWPNKGSIFRVSFPASEWEPNLQAVSNEEIAPMARRLTVLVVDDEEVVRQVAQAALTRAGMRTLLASGGREGIEMFRRHAEEIDLILLDTWMPDLGGRDVLKAVRQVRPEIPVVASSGHSVSDVEKYFGADAPTAILQKPYRVSALARIVAAHTRKTRTA